MSEPGLLVLRQRLEQHLQQLRRRQLVHVFSLRWLLVVPVLLAVATAATLFVHADVNVALLLSQCHARSRLGPLSRVPVVGVPACFLVSFVSEAIGPDGLTSRASVVMGEVLSFIAGLLTVSTVEAARLCNGRSVLIAYPTGAWLVFNLVGGAMVWELVIIPAFLRRSRQLLTEPVDPEEADGVTDQEGADGADDQDPEGAEGDALRQGTNARHLHVAAEAIAIPVAVAIGCVLPSVLLLTLPGPPPAMVLVWLFFPVYVSLLRQGVRGILLRLPLENSGHLRPLHLESHHPSLLAVYAVPVACSVVAHGLLLWSLLARTDDRHEVTRSTLRFVEIDFFFVGLTVLYWVLVEVGWRVVAVVVATSVVLGPGAGLCLGWIYREKEHEKHHHYQRLALSSEPSEGPSSRTENGVHGQDVGEETPLLH